MAILVLALTGPAAAGAQDATGPAVHALIASARHPWARWPDFARYAGDVSRLYAAPLDTLVWHDGDTLSASGARAIQELVAAGAHGLDPLDYDAFLLDGLARRALTAPLDPVARGRFDLLLTVDLVRYLDDLRRGRLHPNPLGARGSEGTAVDFAAAVRGAIQGGSIATLVDSMEPRLVQYRALLVSLAGYKRLGAESLPPVPPKTKVRPGELYAGTAALAARLAAFGDLAPDSVDAGRLGRYEGPLVSAVRRFQVRHGLEPDGILGRHTLAELGTPPAWRVRQIELALERLRWLPSIEGKRILVVNIPAFELFAFDSAGRIGRPAMEMRVIVGRALDRRTPILLEEMRYVEFWPSWNVPRSIVQREILPALRRHPGYLTANQMELVGSRGASVGSGVTPAVLRRLGRGSLGVRQRSGPTNPLGLIKFVFPNAADVYLHGTPLPRLFSSTRRDFSHGCIRVEDPVRLAGWVLAGQPLWPQSAIDSALIGPATLRAPLVHPLPVAIVYTTAVARPDAGTWFYDDLYGQDRTLDEALRTRSPLPQDEPGATPN